MLAVNPNLTPKWATSMRDRFTDGCNVLLPPNGSPSGCRVGAATGVDPAQNRPGAGRVLDDSTACRSSRRTAAFSTAPTPATTRPRAT